MYLTKRLLNYQCENRKRLLFNTLTGAVDLLDVKGREEFQRTKYGDFTMVDSDFVTVLKKRGYLFSNQQEENELLRTMLESQKKELAGAPLKTLICPTFDCNLRCTYCYQGNLREKVSGSLRKENIDLLFCALEEIVRKKQAPGAQIELSGGEPLLSHNYELIDYILSLASERNYPVGIVTNGTNLLEFRPLLEEYRDSIGNVQVTIDGPSPIHNRRRRPASRHETFDRIVKGVDLILDLAIPVVVRTNVDLDNVDYLPELAEFMADKAWNRKEHFRARLAKVENHGEMNNRDFTFSEYALTERIEILTSGHSPMKDVFDNSRISRTLGQISNVLKGDYDSYRPSFYYCEAVSTGLFVFGPDGLLYPCGEAAGNPEFSIGRFVPSLEIDEEKLSYWQDQSIAKIPECHECSIALLCGGGCRYEAAMRINDKSRKILCDDRKKQVEEYMKSHTRKRLRPHEQVTLVS